MPYNGIDPDFIDGAAFNMASVSQDLILDEFLLSKYIDQLPNLKNIIINISYFSFRASLCQGGEGWRCYSYQRYFGYPHKPGSLKPYLYFSLYDLTGHKKFTQHLRKSFHTNLVPHLQDNGFMKRPSFLKEANEEHAKSRLRLHDNNGMITGDYASTRRTITSEKLQQMIDMAEARNIRVIITILPTLPEYYENQIPEIVQANIETLQSVMKGCKNCSLLDLEKSKGFVLKDFWDADHLNMYGAEKTSKLINAYIKSLDEKKAH